MKSSEASAFLFSWGLLFTLLPVKSVARNYESECKTMPSTIHVIKDEYNNSGRLIKRCEEDLAVNKCEGACISKVQPSVNTPSGFLKDCKCCRETHLRLRRVTLNHCYDPDGSRLPEDRGGVYSFELREPAECHCFKCGDSTR